MRKLLFNIIGALLFTSSLSQARPLTLSLNWKPEPEFGGFYAALNKGIFKKSGIDIEIQQGGSGTPNVQMLAAGSVDLIVASGDEILIAREHGSDIVALFSVYQTYPHAIMAHPERKFKNLGELLSTEGRLAVQAGLPYVAFLKWKFPNMKVKLVPYSGGIGTFLHDPLYSQQCFVTSEPISAERAGVKTQTFLVADEGYNPYVTVLAVRKKWLVENQTLGKKIVEAVRQGWGEYLKNPESTNIEMQKLNPSMDIQTFKKAAAVQLKLIETSDTKINGLGSMTQERWQKLAQQLTAIKVLKNSNVADGVLGF